MDAECCVEQILKVTLFKTADVRPLTSHLTHYQGKTKKKCWSLLEKLRRKHKRHSPVERYLCGPTSKNLFVRSVRILGAIERSYEVSWPVGTGGERNIYIYIYRERERERERVKGLYNDDDDVSTCLFIVYC